MRINIPEALNQFKHDNNLTNDYIADYCGVTRSTVSRWCNGKIRKIGPETLAKLAEMLNIDLEDMNRIRGLQLLSLIHISEPTRHLRSSYCVFCL